MGNLTHPADAEYIGILEAVVAVLAVKLGMHPEIMMANAIKEIANQIGMETKTTDRLIDSRWSGRNINQIVHVAKRLNGGVHDIRGQRALVDRSDDTIKAPSIRERAKKRYEKPSAATTLEAESS